MHSFPAGLWSVLGPMQLHPGLRAQRPLLHRWCGRIFLCCSLSIALGLLSFFRNKVAGKKTSALLGSARNAIRWPHTDKVPRRRFNTSWHKWMSFVATGALALNSARRRRFDRHRVWAIRHLGFGYQPHFQRIINWVSLQHVAKFVDLDWVENRRWLFDVCSNVALLAVV
ncbi:unnamed protein product, partial [Phaeothamnion confervicola]